MVSMFATCLFPLERALSEVQDWAGSLRGGEGLGSSARAWPIQDPHWLVSAEYTFASSELRRTTPTDLLRPVPAIFSRPCPPTPPLNSSIPLQGRFHHSTGHTAFPQGLLSLLFLFLFSLSPSSFPSFKPSPPPPPPSFFFFVLLETEFRALCTLD